MRDAAMNKRPIIFSLTVVGLVLALWAHGDLRAGQKYSDFAVVTPIKEGEWLVIGLPGGREKWNNPEQIVVRIANRLRERKLPGVHIETVENARRKLAIELARNALDRNRNGRLESEECKAARIILYGQSFGGAAVIKAARELQALGVPVQFTLQIDSVGAGDSKVPANVRRAVNLYQANGLIRGEREIRAEDPARTEILGNFQYDYSRKKIPLPRTKHVRWYKRLFWNAHTQMEFDPEVWAKVEELLLGELKRGEQEPIAK